MSMTIGEIEDHAENLRGRLESERGKVRRGEYLGDRRTNSRLIDALEGRVDELVRQCDKLRAQETVTPVPVPAA